MPVSFRICCLSFGVVAPHTPSTTLCNAQSKHSWMWSHFRQMLLALFGMTPMSGKNKSGSVSAHNACSKNAGSRTGHLHVFCSIGVPAHSGIPQYIPNASRFPKLSVAQSARTGQVEQIVAACSHCCGLSMSHIAGS